MQWFYHRCHADENKAEGNICQNRGRSPVPKLFHVNLLSENGRNICCIRAMACFVIVLNWKWLLCPARKNIKDFDTNDLGALKGWNFFEFNDFAVRVVRLSFSFILLSDNEENNVFSVFSNTFELQKVSFKVSLRTCLVLLDFSWD